MKTMEISNAQLRRLNSGDVASAVELSSFAGWNQTAEDWRMLMDLAPDGCFAVEADGQLISTTTIVCYGNRLAWIGMVLTRPEYRGLGFARQLLAHALDYADIRGVETVKLDATEFGKPLYAKFGFLAEQTVERWVRPSTANSPSRGNCMDQGEFSCELDARAFGTDRSIMLKQLAGRSRVYADSGSFLFARAGRNSRYLGPSITTGVETAHALFMRAMDQSPDGSWAWDVLASNQQAVALALELGFSRQRLLTRMVRGKQLTARDDMVYAIAGFELG
jgi:GNAT superfamily N-acetyltransferase